MAFFRQVERALSELGSDVQHGRQRERIVHMDAALCAIDLGRLLDVLCADAALTERLALAMTSLEQAYHYPLDVKLQTPKGVRQIKCLALMLVHQTLQASLPLALQRSLAAIQSGGAGQDLRTVACSIIAFSDSVLSGVAAKQKAKEAIDPHTQLLCNLLFRTAHQDYFAQGDASDAGRCIEFGRLHEMVTTSGGQRRVQERFERAGGVVALDLIVEGLRDPGRFEAAICHGLGSLQHALALSRDDLFSVGFDEVVWGRTFAVLTKSVGLSTLGASGNDTALFPMLNALIRRT